MEQDDDPALRARLLGVALEELTMNPIAQFSLETVADAAGVGLFTVKTRWPSRNELYAAALIDWGQRTMPVPDTGSLRGDWTEFAHLFVDAVNSPVGRRILAAITIMPTDWDFSDMRETFQRARTERLSVMARRAIARGECAEDADPVLMTHLLSTCLSMQPMFYGELISHDHAERVVGILLDGFLTS